MFVKIAIPSSDPVMSVLLRSHDGDDEFGNADDDVLRRHADDDVGPVHVVRF
jgi:hypothetical protein